jgi:hypothetical protein
MNSVPPKLVPANAWFAGIILATVALGGAAVVFFFNPATHSFYPVCQFHRLTGLNCPGCGMTRALYALLHGNFFIALQYNVLLVLLLLALATRLAWFGWNKSCDRANGEFFPLKFLWPLLVVAMLFTVLRNLPPFSFLTP